MKVKAADQKLLQELNRATVLNVIHHHGSISRIDISKLTKLSQSTVSNVVDALQKENIVRETGTGSSTKAGGRRPTLISINPNGGFIVSVVVITEAFHITVRISLFNLDLKLIQERETELNEKGVQLIDSIKVMLREFLEQNSDKNILGIGISVPTVLNSEGFVFRGHLLELEHFPLEQEFQRTFPNIPVVAEQEQHAAILGERALGSGKDVSNLIYITVGRGIGASIIVNNQLVKGENGGAGEIGHMTINKYGAKCFCGKVGCLRLYATELAFIEKIKEAVKNELPVPHTVYNPAVGKINVLEIYKEAVNGDAFCRELLFDMLENLSVGLSNLIYLMNPKKIIIGGNLLMAKSIAIPYLNDKMKSFADSPSGVVEVVGANLENSSSDFGVASIILDKYFLRKDLLLQH